MLFSGTAIAYYVGIMSCAAFLCFLGINRVISKSIHDCFVMAVVCILILDVAEMGDIFFSEYPEPSSLRYIFSATGYSVRPMIVFAITCITLRGSRTKLVQMNILLIIVNAVLAFSSILWGTVFSFDETNHFVRGSLGALPFIVSSIMLFEFLALGISKGGHFEPQESFTCVVIFFCCIISAVIETLTDVKGLVSGMGIASVVFYYMYFLVRRLTHDELTDVYLRNRFFSDVERVRRKTYVISIDLNGMKNINDQRGHFAGDKALRDFADAVISCLPSNASLYRIGGDEFAILYMTDREKNVTDLISRIDYQIDDSELTFSAGYAVFSGESDFSPAFEKADGRMYEEKRKYHLGVKKGL